MEILDLSALLYDHSPEDIPFHYDVQKLCITLVAVGHEKEPRAGITILIQECFNNSTFTKLI